MEKIYTICRIRFISPFHIGDVKDDYSISLQTIASDTMYSSLMSCLAKIGDSDDINRIKNNGDLGFKISSLFPFYQKKESDEILYFFPKPLSNFNIDKINDRKKVKNIKWVQKELFELILQNDELKSDFVSMENDFLTNNSDFDCNFIVSSVTPRVTILRLTKDDAKPFYMDKITFKYNSGLFFLIEGDKTNLVKSLNLLRTEGLGTDRNVGNGFFDYEIDEISLNLPNSSTNSVSLSFFIPKDKNELEKILSSGKESYNLQRRGGWITTYPYNTLRKNYVYGFSEGSVFPACKLEGKMVNLNPNSSLIKHPIWRNGEPICLPIILE